MTAGFTPFPELLTERLLLRQLAITDASEIFSLRSSETVNKYLDRPRASSLEDARTFIERIVFGTANDHWIYWAICFRDQPELLGTICLWNFSDEERKAEIGYELMEQFQSRGIMQEAFSAVVQFAFEVLQLNTIEAWTVQQNDKSIKILERNHFERNTKLEDKIDRAKEGPDCIIFSLAKKDFLSCRL
jgi:[ribosomal protein S5]-alanine N-acetyltransferase